jgi:hypothetical protein
VPRDAWALRARLPLAAARQGLSAAGGLQGRCSSVFSCRPRPLSVRAQAQRQGGPMCNDGFRLQHCCAVSMIDCQWHPTQGHLASMDSGLGCALPKSFACCFLSRGSERGSTLHSLREQ